MAEITWKSILTKLVGGDHLSAEESEWFVDDLMNGNANPAAVGAVLATQQQLGLTAEEVRGAAKAMVAHAVPLEVDGEVTDIVGTGKNAPCPCGSGRKYKMCHGQNEK